MAWTKATKTYCDQWERSIDGRGYQIADHSIPGVVVFNIFVEDDRNALGWRPIGYKRTLSAAKAFAARHAVTGYEMEG